MCVCVLGRTDILYILSIYTGYWYTGILYISKGFPDGPVVKNLSASAGDTGDEGLIPGSDQKMHACMLDFIYVYTYI